MPTLKEMSEEQLDKNARAEGWIPEDEFQGDPPRGGFRTAYEFLKRSDDILPVVRGQNKKLKAQLDEMQKEMKQISADSIAANEILQRSIAAEKRDNERLLAEAQAKRASAITEGDGDLAVRAEAEIHELRTRPAAYDQQSMEATASAWRADNTWFDTNEVMQDWAKGYSDKIRAEGVPPGTATLAKVAEKARALFPDYFSSKEGVVSGPGDLTASGRSTNNMGAKGFDDLPDEAQEAYYSSKKLIPGFTQKQYLAQYEWGEE